MGTKSTEIPEDSICGRSASLRMRTRQAWFAHSSVGALIVLKGRASCLNWNSLQTQKEGNGIKRNKKDLGYLSYPFYLCYFLVFANHLNWKWWPRRKGKTGQPMLLLLSASLISKPKVVLVKCKHTEKQNKNSCLHCEQCFQYSVRMKQICI